MSFPKLAADEIVDESAVDPERAASRRKKILLGLVGLAGIATVGGLAYANRDNLGKLLSKKEEPSVGEELKQKLMHPSLGLLTGFGAAAAVGSPAWQMVKDRGKPTAEAVHQRLVDPKRFPEVDKRPEFAKTWVGPANEQVMETVKRMRTDNLLQASAPAAPGTPGAPGTPAVTTLDLLGDWSRNNPGKDLKQFHEWVRAHPNMQIRGQAPRIVSDTSAGLKPNAYMKWHPQAVGGRFVQGTLAAGLPALANYLFSDK
jgi:hypothetical protein